MPHNWRLLERELVEALRHAGFDIEDNYYGDKLIADCWPDQVNITALAQALAPRVSVNTGNVKVVI